MEFEIVNTWSETLLQAYSCVNTECLQNILMEFVPFRARRGSNYAEAIVAKNGRIRVYHMDEIEDDFDMCIHARFDVDHDIWEKLRIVTIVPTFDTSDCFDLDYGIVIDFKILLKHIIDFLQICNYKADILMSYIR